MNPILSPTPSALSLSKGCSFLLGPKKEQGFDKLSPNGFLGTSGKLP